MSTAYNVGGIALCLDTSGETVTVSVARDGVVGAARSWRHEMRLSETLLKRVDEAIGESGVSAGDIDYLAVVTGPGSFTGIRIGIATVKAIADARSLHVAELNALELIAASVADARCQTVAAAIPCRGDAVYGAAYRGDTAVLEPRVYQARELALAASQAGVANISGPAAGIVERMDAGSLHEVPTAEHPAITMARLADRERLNGRLRAAIDVEALYLAPPPITLPRDRTGYVEGANDG